MKPIVNILLGIILGLFTIDVVVSAIVHLIHFQFIYAIIEGAFGYLMAVLTGKLFKEI
jgi:hypothetical protein